MDTSAGASGDQNQTADKAAPEADKVDPKQAETQKIEADKAAADKAVADKAAPDAAKAEADAKAASDKATADAKAKTDADAKATADKKAAEAAQKRAPEKYEIKLPEGVKLPDGAQASIEALARELDLTNEQATKLAEQQAKAVADEAAAGMERLKQATAEWAKEVESDKDLGGAQFEATKELCRRAIDKLGDDKLKAALDSTGYGNFPPLVRMMAKVGKLLSEDKIIAADGAANPSKRQEDILYDAPIPQ